MKKFSKSINQKINEEPKKEYKVDEALEFKHKLLSLMERFLKVQSYGPVDDRYLNGSVTIEGKEMLAEALIGLLTKTSNDKQTSVLESLKSKINDWEVIDEKIDAIKNNNISFKNKIKFDKFIDKHSNDEESLIMITENKSKNIKNKETLNDYIKLLENYNISDETKISMREIYEKRIIDLK